MEIVRTTGTFLQEKEYQVKQPLSGRRLGAAIALTGVTLAGSLAVAPAAFAGPAAPAHPKPAAAASTTASEHGSQVKPASAALCTQTLELWGYDVTVARGTICLVTPVLSVIKDSMYAYAWCFGAMAATGVGLVAAGDVCLEAADG
jgi:hypothetical protein